MKPNTFSVALYKGKHKFPQSIYTEATKFFDRGPYSHNELVFSDGVSASSSFLDGGVRFKNINYSTPGNWDFIILPLRLEDHARRWFHAHEGEDYDILGNIAFGLGFIRDSRKKSFCSEAIASALGWRRSWMYGPSGLADRLLDEYGPGNFIKG